MGGWQQARDAFRASLREPGDDQFTCYHCGSGPWHVSWALGTDEYKLAQFRSRPKPRKALCPNCSGAD